MKFKALSVLYVALIVPAIASAAIFVKIPNMGDSSIEVAGYDDGEWFVADSFSFGVERELSESGEKGGTEDINIGVGELQECTISKSMDTASARLMQFAINGNSPGVAEIHFVNVPKDGPPTTYLIYKLDRCFVKSWSTSGDADDRPTEEVAFYYNRIALQYYQTKDGNSYTDGGTASWDRTKDTPWSGHGIPTTPGGAR